MILLPIRPYPNHQNIVVSSVSIHQQNLKVMQHCISLRKRKEGAFSQFMLSPSSIVISKVFPFSSAQRNIFERVLCKCDPNPKTQAPHSSLAALHPTSGGQLVPLDEALLNLIALLLACT